MPDYTNNADELDRDVALRRERLERDLQELQARLSPGQLLDEGLNYLRRSQGADFVRNLGESVRDRPLPVALVGIGLAWLAASGAGPTGRSHVANADEPGLMSRAWEAGRAVARQAGETEAAYRERVLQARAQVLGVARQAGEAADAFSTRIEEAMYTARDRASALRDRVVDTAGQSYARATDAASQGYARAQDYAGRAGDYASRTADVVSRNTSNLASTISDNPVLLGALGLVAGALLGAVIPRSRSEEEMLAPLADRTVETARDVAGEALDRGERVARAAVRAGMEAANDAPAPDGEPGRQTTTQKDPAPSPRAEPGRVEEGPLKATPVPGSGTQRTNGAGSSPLIG
jgi:hypothetical protein